VTGPLLLVLGLSGSALVFAPEIEQALDGPKAVAAAATPAPSLARCAWGCSACGSSSRA
jgi:uncharacterized iron-regulated membrane protein